MRRPITPLLIALWAVLLLGGAFRPQGYDPNSPPRPAVGYPAPDLQLVSPAMEPVSLADLRGKAVFVNFWASWCGPCRMEMPEIQRLHDSLPEEMAILAINMTAQESAPETPLAYLEQHGFTFPVALDPSGEAGERYRAISLPTSLFISPNGLVTARVAGPLSQRAMADYLAEARSARPAAPGQAGLLNTESLRRLSPAAYLPDAIALGPAVLPTRALFLLAGAALAAFLAGRWAQRAGLEADSAQDLVLNLVVGGVLGAKLIYVVLDPAAYLTSPSMLVAFPYGEWALPGALLGASGLAAWSLRKQAGRLVLLDQSAPALTLGAALGAAGSPEPGGWALFLFLLAARLFSSWLRQRSTLPPGHQAAADLVMVALAVALADLARPAPTPGGITGVQGTAALLASAAWNWQSRPSGRIHNQ